MGASSGPGFPLTLRCAKCKGVDNGRGYKLRATGRMRRRHPSERSQGIRQIAGIAEYECLECGHKGWSKHGQMQRLLGAIGIVCPSATDPGAYDWLPPEGSTTREVK